MYNYQEQKKFIFTEEGQLMFLRVRDTICKLHNLSGAFTASKAIGDVSGNSWDMMACLDRLVEIGEIKKVAENGYSQNAIYIKLGGNI